MSTAPQYNPHYTLDDYQQWKGAWELWNGVGVYESIPFADTLDITVCDQCVLYVRVDRLFE